METKKKTTKKKATKKKNRGTPIKYDPNVHPDLFIQLSKTGMAIVEIAMELGISKNTLYRWAADKEEKPEFVEAFEMGKTCIEAWWSKLGRGIAMGKVKNASATNFIWMTKCQLNWTGENPFEDNDPIEDLEF